VTIEQVEEVEVEMVFCETCGASEEWENRFLSRHDWHRDYAYGEAYCDSCHERMVDKGEIEQCYQCGEQKWSDDIYYCENCEDGYCESCDYDHESECRNDNENVHDYSYIPPTFNFNGINAEKVLNNVYFGAELEFMNDYGLEVDHLASLLVEQQGEEKAYLKEDSSVTGVEIVTHPATIDYHMMGVGWTEILRNAKLDGHRASTDAGLHVHVSRLGLGDTASEREQVIDSMIIILDMFWDKWTKLARRDDTHWAVGNLNNYKRVKDCKTMFEIQESVSDSKRPQRRYVALNTCPRETVEFRLFGSTLNIYTLRACLQSVATMVYLAKTVSIPQLLQMNFDDVLTTVAQLGYDELFDYKF